MRATLTCSMYKNLDNGERFKNNPSLRKMSHYTYDVRIVRYRNSLTTINGAKFSVRAFTMHI